MTTTPLLEPAKGSRIGSLDQFRGFTVLAMFVVNFVHGMEAVPRLFQHNENWFSLADWIMPGFLFAVGMSFRLTWRKRVDTSGFRPAVMGYIKRSFLLGLISVMAFGFGGGLSQWSEWNAGGAREFFAALLKARMWEVLAIIGVSQLLLLPVIGRGTAFRVVAIVVLLVTHAALSQWFNVHFVLAQPNALDAVWGAANVRAWDGGFFGVLAWSSIVLAGTVAYDLLVEVPPAQSARRFLVIGFCCMGLGYGGSCLSTLYDFDATDGSEVSTIAESPVIPKGTDGALTLAEVPFTALRAPEQRQVNYWMMSKRLVTVPFVVFACGFVFIVLAVFVIGCDRRGYAFSVFRILGGNALLAYLLHYVVAESMRPLVPKDSPLWFVVAAMALYLLITIGAMRALERQRLYLRL